MRKAPATSSIAPCASSALGIAPSARRARADSHTARPCRLTKEAPTTPVRKTTPKVGPTPIRLPDQTRMAISASGTPTKMRNRSIPARGYRRRPRTGIGTRAGIGTRDTIRHTFRMENRLERLEAGMAIPYGGDRLTYVDSDLASAFRSGDRLVVLQDSGDLLHISRSVWEAAERAVDRAYSAFQQMGTVNDEAISRFYRAFAERLEDDATFDPISKANQADVADATARGRSTTRLELTDRMRKDMIAALRIWEKTQ